MPFNRNSRNGMKRYDSREVHRPYLENSVIGLALDKGYYHPLDGRKSLSIPEKSQPPCTL